MISIPPTTKVVGFLETIRMKSLWGRKISDLAFDKFLKILEWIAIKENKKVEYIDRFFASSKLCNVCGWKNEDLELRDRKWKCICGTIHDRDYNASLNILRAGASAHGEDKVRLSSDSKHLLLIPRILRLQS